MSDDEKRFEWIWDLESSPEALWPYVSDTDRFNRDCGFPAVTLVPPTEATGPRAPDSRRLRARHLGITVEWDERPFDWSAPRRFGVDRIFHRGPLARIRAQCELLPREPSGTRIVYQTWYTPANAFGRLALAVGGAEWVFQRPFARVFRRYDQMARTGARPNAATQKLSPGGKRRLTAIEQVLVSEGGQPREMVNLLAAHVAASDDLSAQRIRAYALADTWRTDRRQTLTLCLHAVRAGMLDFRWDVLCPHCRGAKVAAGSLYELNAEAYCDTCEIDFVASFDRSIELTFTPSAAIRRVDRVEYCVGGPQLTPHVLVQEILPAGATADYVLPEKSGRFRVRAAKGLESHPLRLEAGGTRTGSVVLGAQGHPDAELSLQPGGGLTVANPMGTDQRIVIEHLAWSDQSTTAAEVTALQVFRDLFAREVLRPGRQVSVSSLTVLFTDLKDSTQLYLEIGDAPAFGRVLTHFDILKHSVETEGGAIVKTMGDAIMAVFPRPAPALRAMHVAQRQLALARSVIPWHGPPGSTPLSFPLILKAGLHHGPCIAINQNDRLDYFGTTVNTAARLCSLSTGRDFVLSEAAHADLETRTYLDAQATSLRPSSEVAQLRGLGETGVKVWRVRRV